VIAPVVAASLDDVARTDMTARIFAATHHATDSILNTH
jgi:hypothetical protein